MRFGPSVKAARTSSAAPLWIALLSVAGLAACVGGNGTTAAPSAKPPVANTLAVVIDSGPSGTAINHAYVSVRVCAPGSTSQCGVIDHVLVDTGSWGLRLVGSVLASKSVSLPVETDASGRTVQECATFGGGQTWGPVVFGDITLAGESAQRLPLQVMDDAGAYAPAPTTCGAGGTLINGIDGFDANGVLGVGVFAQDCGAACVSAATAEPIYYGCGSGPSGQCAAENMPLTSQVTNPVAMFASDNNGVIVDLPNLQNANGDTSVNGSLIFGLNTQSDNTLPSTGLTVMGTDASGEFSAYYNGGSTALPSWIDSGTDAFAFDDATIAACPGPAFVGYYCPAVAPLPLSTLNMGAGHYTGSGTVQFAIGNPSSFVQGASAYADLGGGGGLSSFVWGIPFFYGRPVYIGLDQQVAGLYTGPYFAY